MRAVKGGGKCPTFPPSVYPHLCRPPRRLSSSLYRGRLMNGTPTGLYTPSARCRCFVRRSVRRRFGSELGTSRFDNDTSRSVTVAFDRMRFTIERNRTMSRAGANVRFRCRLINISRIIYMFIRINCSLKTRNRKKGKERHPTCQRTQRVKLLSLVRMNLIVLSYRTHNSPISILFFCYHFAVK